MSECLAWCFKCNNWVNPKDIPEQPYIWNRTNDDPFPLGIVEIGKGTAFICPECDNKDYYENCKDNCILRGPISVEKVGYRGFDETPVEDRKKVWEYFNSLYKLPPFPIPKEVKEER